MIDVIIILTTLIMVLTGLLYISYIVYGIIKRICGK